MWSHWSVCPRTSSPWHRSPNAQPPRCPLPRPPGVVRASSGVVRFSVVLQRRPGVVRASSFSVVLRRRPSASSFSVVRRRPLRLLPTPTWPTMTSSTDRPNPRRRVVSVGARAMTVSMLGGVHRSAGAAGMDVSVAGPPCGHLAGVSLYPPLRCQYSSPGVHCTVAAVPRAKVGGVDGVERKWHRHGRGGGGGGNSDYLWGEFHIAGHTKFLHGASGCKFQYNVMRWCGIAHVL